MKKATTSYIQEEQRRFGAVPRVKAVIQGAGLATPIEIDEVDIIECGHLIASRPAYFHDIHSETHTLTLDNRKPSMAAWPCQLSDSGWHLVWPGDPYL